MIVLTLNSGSSSLKFGLYQVEATGLETLMTGETDGGELRAQDAGGTALSGTPLGVADAPAAIDAIARLIAQGRLPAPAAVGHRIVHGGAKLRAHCLIDADVLGALEEASALSPLHAPAALSIIHRAGAAWPRVPQVACLDTAFHADLPDVARTLPLPPALRAEGIQRYGFHGLSCESILHQLGAERPPRLVIAHLGSGASVSAVQDGRSIDTSMGLTPSGGVMMATRSGDLDPGVLVYLLREKGFDAAALEEMVDHRSGLLGVSGLSGDLRELHAAAAGSPDARLAIAMFCRSVAKQVAGMMVALGGADGIVFTGGIGEHDAAVRATICEHLAWAGIGDDAASGGWVRVLPSQEDEQIARHVHALAGLRRPSP